MILTRPVAIAAALAWSVAAGGCGDHDAVKVLEHAAAVTGREDTAQLVLHGTVARGDRTVDITGQGVISTHTGEQEGEVRLEMNTHPAVYDMDFIVHQGAIWMTGSGLPKLPGDKRWLKIDLTRLGGRQIGTPSEAGTSVTSALADLGGVREAEEVGSEKVLGADATHYRAQVDVKRAAAAMRDPAARTVFLLDAGAAKTLPIDVWVDGDDHIVRYRHRTRLANGLTVETTLDLVSFGIPLALGVPSRARTYDATEAAKR